jgi:hypothetical protein
VQRESVERESLANDGKRPLTLENNSSGSVTLGNPGNSVKITLDEISQDHKPTAVQTPPTGAAKTTDSIKR